MISAVAICLPLLLTVRGKYAGRITTVAVEWLVKTHAANTEAKAKTPHAFRRTYGSNLLNDEKYGDLGLTAELLGHSNPATTLNLYCRASQERRHVSIPEVSGICLIESLL